MEFADKDPNIPIAEVYAKVLDLFQDQSRFAQDYYCYDKGGNECNYKDAYCYCILGALTVMSRGYNHRAQCCLQRVSKHLFGKHIQRVNDAPDGYQNVMKALKFARDLWKGYEPTDEELSMPVAVLLEKRNG